MICCFATIGLGSLPVQISNMWELPGTVCRGIAGQDLRENSQSAMGLQETMRFSDAAHGRHEAQWLSIAWCTRMSALHQLWEESGFAAEGWAADLEPAVQSLELVEALLTADQDGEFYRRAMVIHGMWPGPYRPPKAKTKASKKPCRAT